MNPDFIGMNGEASARVQRSTERSTELTPKSHAEVPRASARRFSLKAKQSQSQYNDCWQITVLLYLRLPRRPDSGYRESGLLAMTFF